MATLLNIAVIEPDEAISTLLACNDYGAILLDYAPISGDPVVTEYRTPLRHGSVVTNAVLPPVKESVRVLVTANDDTMLTTFWRGLERAFLRAHERQRTGRGAKVYLIYQLDRLPVAFRSEITSGHIATTPQQLAAGWRQRKLEITFTVNRREDWESTVLTALPLSSKATAKTTNGVTVRNHWDSDAGDGNWVQIDGSDLLGVTETPIRLDMQNLSSGANPSQLWVAHHHESTTVNALNPTLEAESYSFAYSGSSLYTNVAYSGGQAARIVVPNTNTSTLIATYTLPSSLLDALGGIPVRILAKFAQTDERIWLQCKVTYNTVTVVDETSEVLQNSQYLQDFGVVNLPPWHVPVGSNAPLELKLYGRTAAANAAFVLDYLQFLPARDFTVYASRGYGLGQNVILSDDPLNQTLVAGNAGIFVKTPRDGIRLRPQRTQRLYLLQYGVTEISRELKVQAWVRERRWSL